MVPVCCFGGLIYLIHSHLLAFKLHHGVVTSSQQNPPLAPSTSGMRPSRKPQTQCILLLCPQNRLQMSCGKRVSELSQEAACCMVAGVPGSNAELPCSHRSCPPSPNQTPIGSVPEMTLLRTESNRIREWIRLGGSGIGVYDVTRDAPCDICVRLASGVLAEGLGDLHSILAFPIPLRVGRANLPRESLGSLLNLSQGVACGRGRQSWGVRRGVRRCTGYGGGAFGV